MAPLLCLGSRSSRARKQPGPATRSQHRSGLAAFLWVFGMSFTCPSVAPSKVLAGCEMCQSLSIRVTEGSPGRELRPKRVRNYLVFQVTSAVCRAAQLETPTLPPSQAGTLPVVARPTAVQAASRMLREVRCALHSETSPHDVVISI